MDGEVLDTCPKRPFMPGDQDHAGISDLLWYYAAYKRGQLPDAGGLQDQPGMMMELFRVIDGAVATIEAAEQEKTRREAERGSGGRGGGRLIPKR